jgi:plastocyanin
MRLSARAMSRAVSVATVVAVVTLTGCGGSGDDGAGASGSPSAGASRVGESPSEPAGSPSGSPSGSAEPTAAESAQEPGDDDSPVETDDGAVEIEVEIEDGRVRPSGERVDVEVGQTIRFVVDSDSADEIHVHSTPEHSFSFRAGADDREFEFRLRQPGVVEAELHELGDVVVTLAARP